MCDDRGFEESDLIRRARLSRRSFGHLAGAGAAATLLPGALAGCAIAGEAASSSSSSAASASGSLAERMVAVDTADGIAQAHFVHPAEGAHPAVLVWPDAFGLRDAFRAMGRRLAGAGYAVLTINPYYRMVGPDFAFAGEERSMDDFAKVKPYYESLEPAMTLRDAQAMFAWLDAQEAVDSARQAGTTGYCMGGPMVFRTAAALPGRIGAGASFHGGGLVTDEPDSPHRLVDRIDAAMLVAIAADDDEKAPDHKTILRDAFAAADVKATVEVYPAAHGWMPPDTMAHDPAVAERGWAAKLALFGTAL